MTSKILQWHGLTAQLFLKFLLITQPKVPFINTSEMTKRLSNRTENGKCTDVTNRRSRVGLSTPIYSIFTVPLPWSQRLSFILYWQILRCESLLNFFLLARSAKRVLIAENESPGRDRWEPHFHAISF